MDDVSAAITFYPNLCATGISGLTSFLPIKTSLASIGSNSGFCVIFHQVILYCLHVSLSLCYVLLDPTV